MKCCSLKLGVAVLTFIFGIGAVWIYVGAMTYRTAYCTAFKPALDKDRVYGKVELSFLNTLSETGVCMKNEFLNFEVFNGTGETISYLSEGGKRSGGFQVKIGNNIKDVWGCSTGSKRIFISPGETVIVSESAYSVKELSAGKNEKVQVGFNFRFETSERTETVWSDEFSVSK